MRRAILALLLLALGACAPSTSPAPAHEHGAAAPAATVYACPMHPSVRQNTPGSCPICGMDLVPVTAEEQASGEVIVDPPRRQKVGIVTAPVTRGPLVRELSAFAEVVADQNGLHDVTTKVMGQIRAPAVRAMGERVRAGARLFDLWSPELQAAQAELVAARGTPAAEAAAARLRRWDVPASLIDELLAGGSPRETVPVLAPASGVVTMSAVVDGAPVGPEMPVLRLASLDPIWVEAKIPAEDLPFVRAGATASVLLADRGAPVEGTVAAILPEVDPMTRAAVARVVVPNPEGRLLPGMAAELRLAAPLGEGLSVPADAVIFTGPRRVVFVDRGEGRLAPREVELGARAGERYEVKGGLSEGEQVVSEGAFLVAAESRIRSASSIWGAADAAD